MGRIELQRIKELMGLLEKFTLTTILNQYLQPSIGLKKDEVVTTTELLNQRSYHHDNQNH